MVQPKVSIIGTGNVGYHLALAISKSRYPLFQIIGRDQGKLDEIAALSRAQPVLLSKALNDPSDIYIVCVKDDAIADVYGLFDKTEAYLCHTSGATPCEIIKNRKNQGVFYPLYSFRKTDTINWDGIPLLLENSNVFGGFMDKLANELTWNVKRCNSKDRLQYHLAAVFANNYVNYMYHQAETQLKYENLDFDTLYPIILQTASRILDGPPETFQTGPALRNDKSTLDKHKDLLATHPEALNLYTFIAQAIAKMKKKD